MTQLNFKKKSFNEELRERSKYTPDFSLLRKKLIIPLFVYDDHMVEFQKDEFFPMFKDAEFFGSASTVSSKHKLRVPTHDCDLGPMAFETFLGETNSDRIIGEMYGVNVTHIAYLDRELQNTVMCDRKMVRILCHQQKQHQTMQMVDAYMYIGKARAWEKIRSQLAATVNYRHHPDGQMRHVRGYKHL